MKAHIFIDAFAECLVGVAMATRNPSLRYHFRAVALGRVADKHGSGHSESTGRMFDRLWQDMQKPSSA